MAVNPVADGPLRLAIVSSPRSGNTWMRCLLGATLDLEQVPVHRPEQVAWDDLPRRCVLQIHWRPTSDFRATLAAHGFQALTLARHPLDLLISSLNYAYYVHQEGRCPGGGACPECAIVGRSPRSAEHLEYATTESAWKVLVHSVAWWPIPGVHRVRYEDLVAEPLAVMARLLDDLGESPRRPVAQVVRETAIPNAKQDRTTWHCHYWQGSPGLWRALLPAPEAQAIRAAQAEAFDVLGYACDPDPLLDGPTADANWFRLQLDSTRENFNLERAKHRRTADELAAVRAQLDQVHYQLWVERQTRVEADTMAAPSEA